MCLLRIESGRKRPMRIKSKLPHMNINTPKKKFRKQNKQKMKETSG